MSLQIDVNGEPRTITQPLLADALAELGYIGPALATAVNGDFVASVSRREVRLKSGDRIEVLSPMQGG